MMKPNRARALLSPAAGLMLLAALATGAAAQERTMAHAHMGHVMAGWQDTPDGQGLLPAAIAEADIALQHAGLAARDPSDLQAMQAHAGHVLHALAPTRVDAGPGLGYGLIKAAKAAAQHVSLAAQADSATAAIEAHSTHVGTALDNVAGWSERAAGLAESIRGASDPAAAAEAVSDLAEITEWIRNGRDADGDGRASWQEGEGGLAQARRHMQLMYEAEDLSLE